MPAESRKWWVAAKCGMMSRPRRILWRGVFCAFGGGGTFFSLQE